MQKTENSKLLTQSLKRLISLIILMAVYHPALRAGIPDKPQAYVTDMPGILSGSEFSELDAILKAYEDQSTNQVFILILNEEDAGGRDIDELGPAVANRWQVGQKGLDNGVLITMIVDARLLRIDVGYGLEPLLTDAETMFIRENYMNPFFKEELYAEGLKSGIEQIKKQLSDPDYMDGFFQIPEENRDDPWADYTDPDGFTHPYYEKYQDYQLISLVHGKEAAYNNKLYDYDIYPWISGTLGIIYLIGFVLSIFFPKVEDYPYQEAGTFRHFVARLRLSTRILLFPFAAAAFFYFLEFLVNLVLGIYDVYRFKEHTGFFFGSAFMALIAYLAIYSMKNSSGGGGSSSSYSSSSSSSYSSGSSVSSFSGGGGGSFGGGGSSGSW